MACGVRRSGSGEWQIGRYADVVTVLTDAGAFSSSVSSSFDPMLVGSDPPAHTRVRNVVVRALAQSVGAIKERVQGIASSLLDEMALRPVPELMEHLARPLPLAVMAELLGLEFEQLAASRRDGTGPGLGDTPESLLKAAIDRRVRHPRDDLISRLLGQDAGGEHLDRVEVLGVCKVLLIAGTETTTNLIGSLVLALLRHPDELARLRADPVYAGRVIDETLRCEPPVQFVRRVTLRQVEIAGQAIAAGSDVSAVLSSANRDGRRVAHPDRFDPSRAPFAHLAFGAGPHRCPGASLARLEARLAVSGLISRGFLHDAARADDVEMLVSPVLRGPTRICIAVDAVRSEGERN